MGATFDIRRSRMFRIVAALLVGLLAGTAAVPANAAGQHAPLGYQLMCLQTPPECQGGGKASVGASAELLATLKRVNGQVNRSIRPRYDSGVDVWSARSTSSGDCEDYVLAKRRALIRAGVPASSLRIAYVRTRRGTGHAILVVKASSKDLVLDNLTAAIKPLSQTGYRVISISGANPLYWT